MLRHLILVVLCMLLVAGGTVATASPQKLVLDPTAGTDHELIRVRQDQGQTLTLEFSLPALDLEEIAVDGQTYHGLTVPGGELRGAVGQAGLPVISRLVQVPDNAAVQVTVGSKHEQVFPDFRVFPVQPDEAEAFVVDHDYYAGAAGASLVATPLVEAGAPGIVHGLRVVPITISPVRFDPVSGELRVTDRFEIELDFSGRDTRNGQTPRHSLIPRSFDELYQDVVVNYRNDGSDVGPGSYLLIYAEGSGVLTALEPLLEWRRRQGYNVVAVSTAVTGDTTTGVKNYIQNAYDTYDPPLEFVVLAGDANGDYPVPAYRESLSGYNGEGDHYYSMLAGGDLLADVHIGRLSFRTLDSLEDIVDKIVTYESNPPTGDGGWFTRAGLTGDTGASGITCKYVNQWVKSQLLDIGYTQIDTIFGGNFASQMSASINQGLTLFTYRGWLGMSGFSTGHIGNLSNGYELPYAIIVTCSTGSFWSADNSYSEAFLRNPNGGGIGAVGTATSGTHTRYNNTYFVGAADGALNSESHLLGYSHTTGKLALYLNYIDYEPSKAEIWSVWNNLMGDPATPMWTAAPPSLTSTYPAVVPLGANSVPVTVRSEGFVVENVLVTLHKDGEVQVSGYTDYTGSVNLPLSGYTAGSVHVTATKTNYIPYLGSVNIGAVTTYPAFAGMTIDDDNAGGSSGNGDGVVNPGESLELPVALHNYGDFTALGVSADVSTTDVLATVTDGAETYGNINSGQTVWSAEDFDVTVAPNAPDGHVIRLDLVPTDGVTPWPASLIQLTVTSAAFEYVSYGWSGGGSTLDPGEAGQFLVSLRNSGSITATGVDAALVCHSPWVMVTDGNAGYGTINQGATVENTFDPFILVVSSDCFEGHLANFELTLDFGDGYIATAEFGITVGSISSSDPLGPDVYGYYAIDNTDVGYPDMPLYNWIEIDPNYGGGGTDAGLSDFGWEQDDVDDFALPFTFQYYGQSFDRVSIASNGYIALGVTSMVNYQNHVMPGPGGAPNMIAPYWDNLYQTGGNRVYYRSDVENGRFIVEWSRMRADYNNATQTVQVILYDPEMYPTATGDGKILFQYAQVSNTDARDGYATVGIQNEDHTDGIGYTYGADYPAGAATLSSNRAIMFVPRESSMTGGTLSGVVTNASDGGTPLEGAYVRVIEEDLTMISQADGTYVGAVPAGSFTVRAEHPSFELQTVPGVTINAGEVTELDFALVDNLGPLFSSTTVLPFTDDTTGPYVVDTYITDYSTVASASCFYRVNGATTVELPLALIDAELGHYRAEIPGQPVDSEIEYWLEATDVADNMSRDPAGADNYSFWILEVSTVFHDDMETDQGWTTPGPDDTATSGLWVRVDPNAVTQDPYGEVQPEDDATIDGTLCWITGNDPPGSAQGVDDVDNGYTTLYSPSFDLSEAVQVTVSYRRWYTNDTGNNPGEDVWVVEVNDGSGWVALENTNVSDRSWSLQSFLLDDYIDMTATVQLRFIAADEPAGSVVEAGVDEFLLRGFALPDPDSVADDELLIPTRLALRANYPNPFNPKTQIGFDLPAPQAISLRIFDVNGRQVRTLAQHEPFAAGVHRMEWNGCDDQGDPVGSGVYFYVLETPAQRLTGKMALVK